MRSRQSTTLQILNLEGLILTKVEVSVYDHNSTETITELKQEPFLDFHNDSTDKIAVRRLLDLCNLNIYLDHRQVGCQLRNY